MRLTAGVLIGTAALLVLLASTSSAYAATLKVGPGKTHATIAEAVAAASSGDRIVVFRGRYTESVTIAGRSDLTLLAKRGVEWSPGSWAGQCLTLSQGAHGTRVQGFMFRTTGIAVSLEGTDRVEILKCRFRGASAAIAGVGDDATITKCDVRRGNSAIQLTSDRARVERTTIIAMNDRAIDVIGDGAVIGRNLVSKVADHSGIAVEGDDAVVTLNRVRGAQIHGIAITGHDAVVARNTVAINANDGVHVQGDRALVERNTIRSPGDDGIEVLGAGFDVRSNRVYDVIDGQGAIHVENLAAGASARLTDNLVDGTTSVGIRIEGQGVQSTGNRVTDCAELGFQVLGSDHVLTNDSVRGVGLDGFRIQATGVELVRCIARECGADGFRVSASDVTLVGCRASDCDADGLHNDAVSTTTFSDCTLVGNRQDVGADPTGDLVDGGGNRFVTGGTDAPSVD